MKLPVEKIRAAGAWIAELSDAFIDRQVEKKFRWLGPLWVFLLFVAGILFWGNFLQWGRTPLDFEDWGVINSPRLDFFSDALRNGNYPLHMKYEKFEGQEHPLHLTDRFFAMPDVITTPQALLLKWTGVAQFVLVDVFINLVIATFGLLWFRRKYNLSLLAYGILFVLFSFNGYIQAHYGVGHITWAGYFMFPLLIALFIQLLEEDQPGWMWVGKIAFLLAYMVLAGSQHHFTWALMFLGILALVCRDKFKWIFWAGLFSGLLSAVRLLPPVLILQDIYDISGSRLLSGYPTVLDVWRSMVNLVPPAAQNFIVTDVSWLRHWEFDVYVGLAGAVFLIYFGGYRWLKNGAQYPSLQKLFIPALVIFILTIGRVYAIIRALHIPLLDGERVPARMIALPLAVLILVAAVSFQTWLDQRRMHRSVLLALAFTLFFLIGHDLWAHALAWNLDAFRMAFGPVQMTLAGNSVGNHMDRPYFVIIILGTLLSTGTGLFLLFRMRQEYRMRRK